MTRVRRKDGMVFVTQLSDHERKEIQMLRQTSAAPEEWRTKMDKWLARRGHSLTDEDQEVYAWT